jgi:hypothetical protein
MIKYIPASAAKELSKALWLLANPNTDNRVTSEMFPIEVDKNGAVWLVVNDEFQIIVHPDAKLGRIADILQPWVDSGHLPADTIPNLAALVSSLAGKPLVVYSAFPQLFKDMSKSEEELAAEGLIE